MLPWFQGRANGAGVAGPAMQESEEYDEGMGLRAMAMKAIAGDLISALQSNDTQKVANVLECFAQCLSESIE